jgi:transposase
MHIASIGIDLGKTTFHLVALGERNKILLRKDAGTTRLAGHAPGARPTGAASHRAD